MIQKKIADIEHLLDKRLEEQKAHSKIEGEQWFRDPLGWLLVSFNNPLNYGNPNGELVVLQNYQAEIGECIRGYNQIFYGVGVGETELELVRIELEQSDHINVEAVDISETFINLFEENLRYKELEFPGNKIEATLFRELFQNYSPPKTHKRIHVVLGGTLGNFDNDGEELWQILQRNTPKGDILLIGMKLDTYIDVDFEKYKNNKYYPTFVLSHLDHVDENLITWKKGEDYIRMFYDESDVFRTRRVSKEKLIEEAHEYDFVYKDAWVCQYNHSLIALFEKSK